MEAADAFHVYNERVTKGGGGFACSGDFTKSNVFEIHILRLAS